MNSYKPARSENGRWAGESLLPCPRFLAVLAFFCCALSSCFHMAGRESTESPLYVKVENANKATIDPELEKTSEAIHYYLMGQLSYVEEDFASAVNNFTKASELVTEPAPLLHSKLAELHLRSGELQKALEESEKALSQDPTDNYNLLLQAGILDALNRQAEAEPIYEGIIQKEPGNQEAYVLLSSLYLRTKQPQKSLTLLQKLVERAPKESLPHYYLGRAYESVEKLGEAEKQIQIAHELDRENMPLALDLLRILVKQKKIDAARALCNKILEKDPNNISARKVMGFLLLGESRYEEALEHLKVLETLEDDATETRFKIALVQIERQNFKEAIRELTLVLAQKPDHEEARYYLASIYAGAGRRKEAVEELFKISSEQPLFIKSRTFAAFILRQDGRFEEAERSVREALDSDKENPKLFGYLIVILRDAKKFKEAASLVEKALRKNPQDDELLFNYAIILHDLKREDDSAQAMEKVIVANPKHSDALNFIAYALAEDGKELERAKGLIDRALEIKPKDGYYLDTLGWIYYQQGNFKEAEAVLGQAVNLTGDDILIMEHYGDALIKTGNTEKAVEVYNAALERGSDTDDQERKESADRIRRKLHDLGDVARKEALNTKPK